MPLHPARVVPGRSRVAALGRLSHVRKASMPVDLDATADDLHVWHQEAEEQLQLLDEDLIKLERDGDDPDLLQEIFRRSTCLRARPPRSSTYAWRK